MRLLMIILFFSFTACMNKAQEPKITGKEGQEMPDFKLLMQDSATVFNTSSLQKGKPAVIMYISPTCPYCRMEMRRFTKKIDQFKDWQIIVVASNQFKQVKHFREEFKVDRYPNVILGFDPKYAVSNYFKTVAVPLLAIYDTEKKLVKAYSGAVPLWQIEESIASNYIKFGKETAFHR